MEDQKFVVSVEAQAEIVKFKGFDEEGKEIGETVTLVNAIDSEKWVRDPADDDLWKSFQVIHPEFRLGHPRWVNDARVKFPDVNAWVDAFEVTFLMTPNRFSHPRSECAWIKRVILDADAALELQIPSDWPEDKFWPRFAHRKVSELKSGDFLGIDGLIIDGESGEIINYTVQIVGVLPLGKLQLNKLEVTTSENCDTIWIDGIPFSRPLTKDELDELEHWENGLDD